MATFSPSVIAAELVAGAANTALLVTKIIKRMALLNMAGFGRLLKLIGLIYEYEGYQMNIFCQ